MEEPEPTLVGALPNGALLLKRETEVGGVCYYTNETDEGLVVFDTSLMSDDALAMAWADRTVEITRKRTLDSVIMAAKAVKDIDQLDLHQWCVAVKDDTGREFIYNVRASFTEETVIEAFEQIGETTLIGNPIHQ